MIAEREWTGGAIAEPGVYAGVPMDAYHGDLCVEPSVSSSGLRLLERKSPLHYYDGSYLNLHREREDKPHFVLGRAVHTLLLSEEGFERDYVVRPAKWRDYKTKLSQEWRDQQLAAGLSIVTTDDLARIEGMAGAIARDPVLAGLLRGRVERTIVWRHEGGVWKKARPDCLPSDDNALSDLKITTDASGEACDRSIRAYGYDQQLALAAEGLAATCGFDMADTYAALLFIEHKRPFATNVKVIEPDDLWRAMRANARAADLFAACVRAWDWPSYADAFEAWRPPDWFRRRRDDDPSLPDATDPRTEHQADEAEGEMA